MTNSKIEENMISPDPNYEMIDSQPKNLLVDIYKLKPPSSGILPFLKILTYLSFVVAIISTITIFAFPELIQLLIIIIIFCIGVFIFLFPINRVLEKNYNKKINNYNVLKAKNIYIKTAQLEDSPKVKQIMEGVEIALSYTEELLERYRTLRVEARFFYYLLQITTIIFSAVTPILVLVEKSETAPNWLKWLPVIFPAIAAIVASLSTAFSLEENYTSANEAIENLESEKNEFLLGVTAGYRIPRYADEDERYKNARDAMAKFMNQVKSIHLKQLKDQEKAERRAEEGQKEPQQQEQKVKTSQFPPTGKS
ncbi:DUF4231 domain-containing protein [Okeania sp.]|uniref:DUF4231 domain-containing protein n=1 Tax=Okeania sp. TaxID=3100323 RepID=UPI002B4AE6DC|nr:DUF4231 domain-containing protein [Okeania sp.]MEB3339854.1 DUF4231 domain-containing protein [Okeania sp.]